MVKVLLTETTFAIEAPVGKETERGEFVDYGEVATVEAGPRRYIAICDDSETAEVFELTRPPHRRIVQVPATTEDVEVEEDDEDTEVVVEDDDDEQDEEDAG